jgi:hypothetical protein
MALTGLPPTPRAHGQQRHHQLHHWRTSSRKPRPPQQVNAALKPRSHPPVAERSRPSSAAATGSEPSPTHSKYAPFVDSAQPDGPPAPEHSAAARNRNIAARGRVLPPPARASDARAPANPSPSRLLHTRQHGTGRPLGPGECSEEQQAIPQHHGGERRAKALRDGARSGSRCLMAPDEAGRGPLSPHPRPGFAHQPRRSGQRFPS